MREKICIAGAFILFDIISGLLKAISTGTYSSSVMRAGLWHKVAEIMALAFGVGCDYALPVLGVTLPVSLFSSILVYLGIMESGSIIENIGIMFPDLGKYLSGIFEKVGNNKDE